MAQLIIRNSAGIAVILGLALASCTAKFAPTTPPTVIFANPTTGPVTGGTVVTITGTGFLPGLVVTLGGTPCNTVNINSTTNITCATPAHLPGSVDVVITSTDGTTGTLTNGFSFMAPPTVSAIVPPRGPINGGNTVVISGGGFRTGASVTIGGTPCATSTVTPTTIICKVGNFGAAGVTDVFVLNPDAQSARLTAAYTYEPAPTVTGLAAGSVTNGPPTGGGTMIINGTGFLPGASVLLGTGTCVVSLLSATQISCTVPGLSPGTYPVSVTNPDGQVSNSFAGAYVSNVTPTILSINNGTATPQAGKLTGGLTLTITGSGFDLLTPLGAAASPSVTVGGVVCPLAAPATTTSLQCTLPSFTPVPGPGAFQVQVFDADTQVASFNFYSYDAVPTISTITPNNGMLAAGTTVTINGTGFIPGMTVKFVGSAAALPCGPVSGGVSIVCTAPAATTVGLTATGGSVDVVVTNLDTQTATKVTGYAYNPFPTVGSTNPAFGAIGGGTSVTITGTGFRSGAIGQIDGVNCTSTTFTSSTSVTCTSPAHVAASNLTVSVVNPDTQSASLINAYAYIPPPSISSLVPAAGATIGGTLVAINGTNFLAGATAAIGGTNCTSTVVVSATRINCIAPAESVTGLAPRTVTVSNTDGQVGSFPNSFSYLDPFQFGTKLASGLYHSCALRENGTVWCWGNNDAGQVGDGTTLDRTLPTQVVDSTDPNGTGFVTRVQAVATGDHHSCVLISGRVFCWGLNANGQLGNNSLANISTLTTTGGVTSCVQKLGGGNCLTGVKAIVAGSFHTCALLTDGTVQCWGLNDYGEIGDSTTTTRLTATPATFGSPDKRAVAITAGEYHTCAIVVASDSAPANLQFSNGGTVYCWGRNDFGQLGVNSIVDAHTPANPVTFGGVTLTSIIQVRAAGNHTCALQSTGSVFCWGDDTNGAVGDNQVGMSACANAAVDCQLTAKQVLAIGGVGNLTNAVGIQTGVDHSCAQLLDGTVDCWGSNAYGQLGDGTTSTRLFPVKVIGLGGLGNLQNVAALSAGSRSSCGLISDGSVRCWGYDFNGQLGNESTVDSTSPVVALMSQGRPPRKAVRLATGHAHNCAVLSNGNVNCWGFNDSGQLGDGTHFNQASPVKVLDPSDPTGFLTNAVAVTAGFHHSCALVKTTTTTNVKCWGRNLEGQLGNGSFVNSDTPVFVHDTLNSGPLNNVLSITAGDLFTCALLITGQVNCWGNNAAGELGSGNYAISNFPVVVQDNFGNLDGVSHISSAPGSKHTCAVRAPRSSFTVNSSNTGAAAFKISNLSSTADIEVGSTVVGPGVAATTVVSIDDGGTIEIAAGTPTAGAQTYTFSSGSGGVYCWGLNNAGQLGSGGLEVMTGTMSSTTLVTALNVGNNDARAILSTNMAVQDLDNPAMFPAGTTISGAVTSANTVTLSQSATASSTDRLMFSSAAANSNRAVRVCGENASAAYKGTNGNSCLGVFLTKVASISTGDYHSCAVRTPSNVVLTSTTNTNPTTSTSVTITNGAAANSSTTAGLEVGMSVSGAGINPGTRITSINAPPSGAAPTTWTITLSAPATAAATVSLTYSNSTSSGALAQSSVVCWGDNTYGQLGQDKGALSGAFPIPVLISGTPLTDVMAVAAGADHTCALLGTGDQTTGSTVSYSFPGTVGKVACWGLNTNGQLGNNTPDATPLQHPTPGIVAAGFGGLPPASPGLDNVVSLGGGGLYNCALSTDGTAWCWGYNFNGQIGDGTTLERDRPANVTLWQ